MRLRRETGDWTIKVDGNSVEPKLLTSQLPKGLSAEDFIGAVVDAGEGYQVIAAAYIVTNAPYSVRVALGKNEIFYDRRSGHLSLDPTDFNPVEPDEGGDDITGFVVTQEGSGLDGKYTVIPSPVTFTEADFEKYTSPWHKFVGKTVTDVDGMAYTIIGDMIGGTNQDDLYFKDPTEKTGSYLHMFQEGDSTSSPITINVLYVNKSGGVN